MREEQAIAYMLGWVQAHEPPPNEPVGMTQNMMMAMCVKELIVRYKALKDEPVETLPARIKKLNEEPLVPGKKYYGRRLFVDDFEQLYGPTKVTTHCIESSIAFQGAHVWIYQDNTRRGGHPNAVHLDVFGAQRIIRGLEEFVQEAHAGLLIEGVLPIPEEEEDEEDEQEQESP